MIIYQGRFKHGLAVCFFLFAHHTQANPAGESFDSSVLYSQFGQILLGLLVVLGVIVSLALLAKKFNLNTVVQGSIRTLAVTQVSHQTKVILIDLEGQQYLLGVTSQQVNLIDKLDQPVDIKQHSFSKKLRQVQPK